MDASTCAAKNNKTQLTCARLADRYFGTDNVTFEIGSEYPKQELKPRRFSSFSSAAIEIANSRVYGGIHFPSSGPHGLTVGVVVRNTFF